MIFAPRSRHGPCLALLRFRPSSTSSTTPLKLVAELRKRTSVTIQKAREALLASNGDVSGALEWLGRDRVSSGQRKIRQVEGRFAGEGLIGVSVLSQGICDRMDVPGIRAAMVELSCETDFVGRNELFRKLTQDLAFTAAIMADPSPSLPPASEGHPLIRPIELAYLHNAPLIDRDGDGKQITVSEAVRDIITAVGENIVLRRAVFFVHNPIPLASGVGLRVASYVHDPLTIPTSKRKTAVVMEAQGKIGALIALGLRTVPASRLAEILVNPAFDTDLGKLERALARQVVGLNPESIHGDNDAALYNQSFDMLPNSGGQTVDRVLKTWAKGKNMTGGQEADDMAGLSVVEFLRWKVGERHTSCSNSIAI